MVMFALGSGVIHFAAFGALSGKTTTCSSRVPMSGSGMAISPVLSLLMWMLQCADSTSVVAVLFVSVVVFDVCGSDVTFVVMMIKMTFGSLSVG